MNGGITRWSLIILSGIYLYEEATSEYKSMA